MSNKYCAIMEHIQVTPEIERRILQEIETVDFIPRHKNYRTPSLLAAAACFLLILSLPAFLHQEQPQQPVVMHQEQEQSQQFAVMQQKQEQPQQSAVMHQGQEQSQQSAVMHQEQEQSQQSAVMHQEQEQSQQSAVMHQEQEQPQQSAVMHQEQEQSQQSAAMHQEQEQSQQPAVMHQEQEQSQVQPNIQMIRDMETAESLEELSQMVGFQVRRIPALPFAVEHTSYASYCKNTAQITCDGGGLHAVFRMTKGTEDCTGDYSVYTVEEELELAGLPVTLKGSAADAFSLAIWSDREYSYSLKLTQEISQQQWNVMIDDFINNSNAS